MAMGLRLKAHTIPWIPELCSKSNECFGLGRCSLRRFLFSSFCGPNCMCGSYFVFLLKQARRWHHRNLALPSSVPAFNLCKETTLVHCYAIYRGGKQSNFLGAGKSYWLELFVAITRVWQSWEKRKHKQRSKRRDRESQRSGSPSFAPKITYSTVLAFL